jgi:hypothetical protein
MQDNLETIDTELLVTATGGSLNDTVKNRLGQIWGHEGTVQLSGRQTYEGMNGHSILGWGKFKIHEASGATETRSWRGRIVDGQPEHFRTHLISTTGFSGAR